MPPDGDPESGDPGAGDPGDPGDPGDGGPDGPVMVQLSEDGNTLTFFINDASVTTKEAFESKVYINTSKLSDMLTDLGASSWFQANLLRVEEGIPSQPSIF